MSSDLEASIDALYQAPLDRFTQERNALSASLKKAGYKPAAERVKGLSKPSATAWAVNQVWWRHRERVQALLDAGARERQAHLSRAQGQPAGIRDAADARQQAVSDVTEAALQVLGGRKAVAPDVAYRISGTVEALASGGIPDGETPGRLARDLQSSGLGALTALAAAGEPFARPVLVARGTPAASPSRPPDAASTPAPARASASTQVADAQARVDAMASALDLATSAAREAADAEARARGALEAATAHRAGLEAALDEARAAEAAARRDLSKATTAVSRAEMDQARASRDAARAREALERLRRTT